jgi:hypothetical protein
MDSGGGGHLVCVVGYDDGSGTWIVQNSWGAAGGRPDGWFTLPQAMGYGDSITMDGQRGDMWEFDTFTPTGWSNPASTGAPAIATQPANETVAVGASATFTTVATGTAPLTYQWYRGGTAIAGATSASFAIPAATRADNGATFQVVVSNAWGSATSDAATLTVTAAVGSELIVNGGFEGGTSGWTGATGVIGQWGGAAAPFAGAWDAWFGGTGGPASGSVLSQRVTIPATATQATLAFQLHISGSAGSGRGDRFLAAILGPGGSLAVLEAFTGAGATAGYQSHSYDLGACRGQTVSVAFALVPDGSPSSRTSFVLDDVSLQVR